MRASSPSLVLAAALVATACGDSSPASPFTGAATLAEESVGSSQSPINIRTERVNFVGPRGLPSLEFRYGRDVTLDVVNTGSPGEEATVRAEVPVQAPDQREGVSPRNAPGPQSARRASCWSSGYWSERATSTEPVAWVVLKQPIQMSAEQIDAFHELFEEGNSREPQALNGRRVASDALGLQEDRN
jgi:hypothetical protein